MINYNWIDKGAWLNLEWYDEINGEKLLQQICLEPRPSYCDRGRFVAKYATHDRLSQKLEWLSNYYFFENIAKLECQKWANLISKSISDQLIDIKVLKSETVHDNEFYTTSLSTVLFIFESGLEVQAVRFDAQSKDQEICVIDFADFFPRYYLENVNGIIEEDAWNSIWSERKY